MTEANANPLRVVLINPPFQYFEGFGATAANYTRPPLGIAYLAASLRDRRGGARVIRLRDCGASGLSDPACVVRTVLEMRPRLVGFSVVTGTFHTVCMLAEMIKAQSPETTIVAGGPHITVLPDEPMPGVDVKIVGEGEISLMEYVEKNLLGGGRGEVAGCLRLEDGRVVACGAPRPFIEELDRVPIPARDLLPADGYFHTYPYPGVRRFTTLFTSRGCPYHCRFCGNERLWGSRMRLHSLARVREEIAEVAARGYNLIFFDDDTFTADRARVLTICEHLRGAQPRLRWICHARADTIDGPLARAMKAAGCVEVQLGIESGDPQVLRNTDKGLTIQDIRAAFGHLHAARLHSWATVIFGNPGESPATIRRSIDLARGVDPTYCSFIVLLPFPGTRLHDDYRQAGFLKTLDWRRYSWHGYPVISLPGLSDDALVAWRRRANLEFYLRPRKLLQVAKNVLLSFSRREIARNLRAWRSVVATRRRLPPGA